MQIRPVAAVQKAAGILFVLAQANGPMTLSDIARKLGLVPSTCLHILRELSRTGLVQGDPNLKRYELGVGVVALARQFNLNKVGPVTASAVVATVGDFHQFKNGAQFGAWLGLTQRQNSSGGQEQSGRHHHAR